MLAVTKTRLIPIPSPGQKNPPQPKRQTFINVGVQIVQKEGFLSLYKGLGAVVSGIVPKMAIRFSSFEYFKEQMADKKTGQVSAMGNFMGMYVVPSTHGNDEPILDIKNQMGKLINPFPVTKKLDWQQERQKQSWS